MTIFKVNWLFSSIIASPNICTIFSILAASSSVWTLTSCIKTVETVTDSVINGLYSLWILRIGTLGTSATSNVFEACLDKVGWNHGIWTGFLGWQSGSFALFLSKSSKFSIPSLISETSSLVPANGVTTDDFSFESGLISRASCSMIFETSCKSRTEINNRYHAVNLINRLRSITNHGDSYL